ncbi:hypothetical protein [Leptospira kirschneri]|uniref:hypothetical protein n=1 Tax=Leptospira kirschneri TaxID=29507 RepID=UPI0009913BAC|nr:hypothetical protein [Leptospira kirschneri]
MFLSIPLKTNALLHLKTILSLLDEEIRGKVREEYEILNPAKTCNLAYSSLGKSEQRPKIVRQKLCFID